MAFTSVKMLWVVWLARFVEGYSTWSHCTVECALFLTSLLFERCQQMLRACQTDPQNGCQAVRWLPRSEHNEQVQNGDQLHRICWSDFPHYRPLCPTHHHRPKRKGKKPEDARLGISSLARVVVVPSRDSSSHRVLLVSHVPGRRLFRGQREVTPPR